MMGTPATLPGKCWMAQTADSLRRYDHGRDHDFRTDGSLGVKEDAVTLRPLSARVLLILRLRGTLSSDG
jgi:hypothetical protein